MTSARRVFVVSSAHGSSMRIVYQIEHWTPIFMRSWFENLGEEMRYDGGRNSVASLTSTPIVRASTSKRCSTRVVLKDTLIPVSWMWLGSSKLQKIEIIIILIILRIKLDVPKQTKIYHELLFSCKLRIIRKIE